MHTFRNLHLLTDISEEVKQQLETVAQEQWQDAGLRFKVVEYSGKKIIIQAAQGKNTGENHFSVKQLVNRVHETLDAFFPGVTVMVHPIPYTPSPANVVDLRWISKRMQETGTRLKDMAADTGISDTALRAITNGEKPLTQPLKALFYYYFAAKKQA